MGLVKIGLMATKLIIAAITIPTKISYQSIINSGIFSFKSISRYHL
jgi:hypothetical protein